MIESESLGSNNQIKQITSCEIETAISKLNNNKAPDAMGLTSEHMKYAATLILDSLKYILSQILAEQKIPSCPKNGILTPVYEKGPPENPGNYRGITVTPILIKILEHILGGRHKQKLESTQSELQTGFSQGKSSLISFLPVTECQLETKANKQMMLLTTLDTQKAFDVVHHEILLNKLCIDGIRGKDWLLLKNLYSNLTSVVSWRGSNSRSLPLNQGVRQDGVLSTEHYKRYNNPLLWQLENNFQGVRIGSIKIPHTTCADDLALLFTNEFEMISMVSTVEDYSNKNRYKINPTKSSVIQYNSKKDLQLPILHGKTIDKSISTYHLGITHQHDAKVDIREKTALGRRTIYSLMGAGCHGKNGISRSIKGEIWSTYVIPRTICGLETVICNLTRKDLIELEKFQIAYLKQIQRLPIRTSNQATQALFRIAPITSILHKNLLNLIYGIITSPQSIEYRVLYR